MGIDFVNTDSPRLNGIEVSDINSPHLELFEAAMVNPFGMNMREIDCPALQHPPLEVLFCAGAAAFVEHPQLLPSAARLVKATCAQPLCGVALKIEQTPRGDSEEKALDVCFFNAVVLTDGIAMLIPLFCCDILSTVPMVK